jgi:hypothetical protein
VKSYRALGEVLEKGTNREKVAAANVVLKKSSDLEAETRAKEPHEMNREELDEAISAIKARMAQLSDGAKLIEGQAIEEEQDLFA